MSDQRADTVLLRQYRVTTFGEAPASTALAPVRITSENFKANKITVKSKVLGTRKVKNIYKIGEDISGSFNGELAHGEFEFALEAILGSTFTTVTTTQTDISFTAADSSINSSADFGSFVAGQWIKVAGTANHNGYWYVSSKSSSSKLILSDGVTSAGVTMAVQDEAAGASMTVNGKHLRQGTTLHAHTFERSNPDNATFDVWNSVFFDQVDISLKYEDIVQISCSGMGKVADLNNSASFGSSVSAEATTNPFNATNNLMRIKEGSTVLSDELVNLSLSIKANARKRNALGNSTPTGGVQDTVEVTGSAEFYFRVNTRRQAFQDHTEQTTFYTILKDAAGNVFIVTMKSLYWQDMQNNAGGQKQDVLEKYTFEATEDDTNLQSIVFDVL